MTTAIPSRRTFLTRLAASPIAVAGVGVFPDAARAEAQAAGLITPNVCMVTPEVTEGPYYTDPKLLRSDITEDREGVPLRMRVQVVSSDCQPVSGARVDIWHCDAEGNYSGFATQDTSSQTFLRGTQMTGDSGIAHFDTIYPGWYRGRTAHIHYKVFLEDRMALTSQIFFPDALSQYLFQSVAPYDARGAARDTMNGNDGIAKQAGDGAFAAVRETTTRYEADLVVGVNPNAQSRGGMRPSIGAGGPQPDGQGAVAPFVPPVKR